MHEDRAPVRTTAWLELRAVGRLTLANLTGASLLGANLAAAEPQHADLTGANLDSAILNCIGHSVCHR